MERLKLIINAEIELQGKLRFFDKEIRANKIHFFLYTNDREKVQVIYSKLICNENGKYYDILETGLEQGRRFCAGIVIEAEVMTEDRNMLNEELMLHGCSIDSIFKIADTKITNIDILDS